MLGDPASYAIVYAFNQLDSRATHENDRDKSFSSPDWEARWGIACKGEKPSLSNLVLPIQARREVVKNA